MASRTPRRFSQEPMPLNGSGWSLNVPMERIPETRPRTAVPPLLVTDPQDERPKMQDSDDDEATHSEALILDRELFDRSIWWDSLKEMQLDLRMFSDDWLAKLGKALTEHAGEFPLEDM